LKKSYVCLCMLASGLWVLTAMALSTVPATAAARVETVSNTASDWNLAANPASVVLTTTRETPPEPETTPPSPTATSPTAALPTRKESIIQIVAAVILLVGVAVVIYRNRKNPNGPPGFPHE
jgi:hypothetical protein